jgi:uncharacterized RDD family membrane protein YckC
MNIRRSTLALLIVLLPALCAAAAPARAPKNVPPADAANAASAPASAPAAGTATPGAGSTTPDESAASSAGHSDWEERSLGSQERSENAASENGTGTNERDADDSSRPRRHHHHRSDNDIVNFGRDSDLPQGERADSVVSIFGSSSVEGEAGDAVSILGNTRVTGTVSDGAVAVFGNTYVDGPVKGGVVAVMGNVELGPNAVVGEDVVAVGGTVHRDPAAIVHGDVQSIGGPIGGLDRVHPWIRHCLLYGRPLAFVDGIGWAWGLAFFFLGLYVCLALLFRDAVTRCAETFEARPGMSVVAALLTVLFVPVLFVLLFVTVIGIAAVPFVAFGLLCAGLFGKAVMLAWIGRRSLKQSTSPSLQHPAVAVLVGGLIVMALYVVPVLGFLVYNVLGLLGIGVIAYTLVGHARAWREGRAPRPGEPSAAVGGTAAGTAAGAAPAGSAATASAPAGTPPPGSAPAGSGPGAVPLGAEAHPAAAAAITAALPRAGFWIRMVALLLDALLVGFLMGLLHHAFHMEIVMLAIYGAIMWKLRGSTIGGIVFDLQVVRLDGRPIDWETAIVRALGCFLSLVVAGLGFFWIAFDHGRQAWHDKIAGTVVVRVPKGVPLV